MEVFEEIEGLAGDIMIVDIPGVDSDLHSNECSVGKNSGQTHQDRPFLPASSGTVRRDHPRAPTAHAR